MPKINVYLSDELAEAVKQAGLPVSPICQHALESAVRKVTAIRETAKLDLTLTDPTAQLASFTVKARTAVRLGIDQAGANGARTVGTENLLAGILAENTNMALNVLRSMDIEPEQLREELAQRLAATTQEPAQPGAGRQLDEPAAAALEAALNEAIAFGHNYIGCEHLLLGLIVEPTGTAGELLRARGAEPKSARRAVAAALSGFVYARSQGEAGGGTDGLRELLSSIVARLDKVEQRLADPPVN